MPIGDRLQLEFGLTRRGMRNATTQLDRPGPQGCDPAALDPGAAMTFPTDSIRHLLRKRRERASGRLRTPPAHMGRPRTRQQIEVDDSRLRFTEAEVRTALLQLSSVKLLHRTRGFVTRVLDAILKRSL